LLTVDAPCSAVMGWPASEPTVSSVFIIVLCSFVVV
jgi:hypothetical protein